MIDTSVRKLLLSSNEEDIRVASSILKHRDILREGLYAFEDVEAWDKKMKLPEVRYYQKKYPELVVSGSIALFLQGARTERFNDDYYQPDFDFIIPYYIELFNSKGDRFTNHSLGSGTSFDLQLSDGISKIDLKIDPKRIYHTVSYNGFDYKVSDVLEILEAKIKYCKDGDPSRKHRKDIYDMIGVTTFLNYLEKAK